MLKRYEAEQPNSCWNKARENEMVFVLLERDLASAETIRFWCKKRIELGKNKLDDAQIVEVLACADYIEGKYNGSSKPTTETTLHHQMSFPGACFPGFGP